MHKFDIRIKLANVSFLNIKYQLYYPIKKRRLIILEQYKSLSTILIEGWYF